MLLAQVARARAIPLDLGVVADDLPGLRAAIRGALLDADLVLLSGGVSKGDLDLVPDALEAEGVRCVFHRWAVQPGGPLWFGMGGGVPFLGLPGNPAASFVAFEVLAVPILAALDGRGFAPRTRLRARYAGPWGKPLVRRRYRPVRLASDEDGVLVAHPETWRGSGDPFVPARMHALAALPEYVADADEERIIDVLPLEPLG
jgi:molybdopterin molybdotransferase